MGKKIKVSSHKDLMHAHEAGAKISINQIFLHSRLGACCYPMMDLAGGYLAYANNAFEEAKILISEIEFIQPSKAQIRAVSSSEHVEKVFEITNGLIDGLYLHFQHFTSQIISSWYSRNNLGSSDDIESQILKEKIDYILKEIVDCEDLKKHQGYIDLVGIWTAQRDSLHHPRRINTLNCNENEWDKVPYAWVLSEKFLIPFQNIIKFKEKFVDVLKGRGFFQPMTYKVSVHDRGLRFDHQYKKAPRE